MDYTKNYHLPQWEKTDRIMMEDFNQMCADMEAGLAGNHAEAQKAAEVLTAQDQLLASQIAAARQEAADRDSKDFARNQTDLQNGLFRMMYNQCAHLLDADASPALDGIFLQRMQVEDIPSNCQGFALCGNSIWCASSGPDVSLDAIWDSFTVVSNMKMVTGKLNECQPGTCTFISPGAARINYIFLMGNYSGGTGEPGRLLVTLDNLTRGTRELEMESTGYLGTELEGHNIRVDTDVCIHGGDLYKFEVTPLAATITGNFEFRKAGLMSLTLFDKTENSINASVSHSFGDEAGVGGLILARYDAPSKVTSLTAIWGGKEQQPLRVRSFTDGKGRAVKEAEFRFTDPIPSGSTVVLKATVPSAGNMILHNWCAALL